MGGWGWRWGNAVTVTLTRVVRARSVALNVFEYGVPRANLYLRLVTVKFIVNRSIDGAGVVLGKVVLGTAAAGEWRVE